MIVKNPHINHAGRTVLSQTLAHTNTWEPYLVVTDAPRPDIRGV